MISILERVDAIPRPTRLRLMTGLEVREEKDAGIRRRRSLEWN